MRDLAGPPAGAEVEQRLTREIGSGEEVSAPHVMGL
jgi:hypothetical protein